jgi:hypothetical protein
MNHDDFDSRKIGGWSELNLQNLQETLVYVNRCRPLGQNPFKQTQKLTIHGFAHPVQNPAVTPCQFMPINAEPAVLQKTICKKFQTLR